MLIREFLCIHEYGTVVFHRKYQSQENSTDIILRSGLISALYNFATETENDSIDFLRMEKVQIFFKKKDLLLFVLFIDSSINPMLIKACEYEFKILHDVFFKRFPEIQWTTEIIDVEKFAIFKKDADRILFALNKKLNLFKFLNDEGFLLENDYFEMNVGLLGNKVGIKLLERNQDYLIHALTLNKEFALKEVDNILSFLECEHIERNDKTYILSCQSCYFCHENKCDCFFKSLLNIIVVSLNLDNDIKLKVVS